MSTEQHYIVVGGVRVEIVRKDIKNLHLGVYPPNGRVRVAAPHRVSDDAVRLAVIGKLAWVKRQRAQFETQPRQSEREMVSGESHYFLGHRYRLRIVPREGPATVALRGKSIIELHVRPDMGAQERERALHRWYRQHLRQIIEPLLEKWQTVLGVQVTECRIKKMKTKWGTCNADARRIWLNLELAKKPVQCTEYVMLHELVHLLERHHTDRFLAIMDRHLPQWRGLREELNAAPLAHESWSY
jgi:predicted metal-dependent hydrolase